MLASLRAALLVVSLALAIALSGCAKAPPDLTDDGATSATDSTDTPGSGTPSSDGGCRATAESLTLEQQVGQLFMVGLDATATTVPDSVAELLRQRRVGAVLLIGTTTSGVDAVASLTAQVQALSPKLPVLVAADQEGGNVQRLQGSGFESIPSAKEQATWDNQTLTGRATVWGAQLQRAGVGYVLAPVADVVPKSLGASNEPIGATRRGYGSDPTTVGEKVSAVVKGYTNSRVATSVKHFPNLGTVRGNTDTTKRVVDTVTGPDSSALTAFSAGIEAGASSVMVSNAVYEKIDPDHPATFSPAVMKLLRQTMGFDGVIVSDDLGVAAAVSQVASAQRGVTFLAAGGDLVIDADPSTAASMVKTAIDRAKSDKAFAQSVTDKATRVLTMKQSVNLVTCE